MKLSTRQYWIPGRETNGKPTVMFVRQDVPGKIHFQINGENIHIEEEELKKVMLAMFPVTGAKHGGTL